MAAEQALRLQHKTGAAFATSGRHRSSVEIESKLEAGYAPFVGPYRRRSTSYDREGMWGRCVLRPAEFEWYLKVVGGVVTGP